MLLSLASSPGKIHQVEKRITSKKKLIQQVHVYKLARQKSLYDSCIGTSLFVNYEYILSLKIEMMAFAVCW